MYESLKFRIVGMAPLMCSNGLMADPMNPWSRKLKEVSGKRKKTDADHAEMSRIEWFGRLYLGESDEPVIPGVNIESMLVAGAKKNRQGREFKSGIICDGVWPIEYDGPKDVQKLWDAGKHIDRRGVKQGQVRIMRTRPIFHKWALDFTVNYLPSVLNEKDVKAALKIAGEVVGLGDYLPRFGRFEVA